MSSPSTPSPLRGILLMMLAVFLFASLDTTIKYLGRYYPVPGLVFARYAVHCLLMILVLAPSRGVQLLATRRPGIQIVRALLLLGSSFFFFVALQYLPLAEAASIGFITPLLITALSVPLLKEKVGPRRWAAVLTGFVGVLIIVRPGFTQVSIGVIFPLLMACCYSTYQILTRKIAGHEDPIVSLFYTALIGSLVMSVTLPFYWVHPTSWQHWGLLLLTGLFGGVGHFILIRALGMTPASVLAPFSYSQLIWVTTYGFLVFGDFPDGFAIFGMLLIVGSGLYIAYREAVLRRAATVAEPVR